LQSFGLQGPGTDDNNHDEADKKDSSVSDSKVITIHKKSSSTGGGYIDANVNGDDDDDDDDDGDNQDNENNGIPVLGGIVPTNEYETTNNEEDELDTSTSAFSRYTTNTETDDDQTHIGDIRESKFGSSGGGGGGKTPMHNPGIFFFGTGLFVTGSLLTFVAFGFAAQSLLASLEGVQFVSNIIFGKFFRNADISCSILLGVTMICGGIATVVLNGSHESETYTSQQLMMLYVNNHAYQAFLVIAGGSAVFLRYVEKAFTKRQKQGKPWPYSDIMIPLTFAIFSAIFGTQSVVQAKCLMMCLSLTLDHQNQFDHPFTYAMLAAWLVFVGVWLTRMGTALK
jgi:hypothetical protein